MPDLTTHLLFAEQTRALLSPGLQAALAQRAGVFRLGAQGPDFFFYHQGGGGGLARYGALLHHEKLREVFLYMAATLPLKKGMEQEVLTAYCMGYVCHYLLDRRVHPFVYAEEKRLGGEGEALHARIEAQIDSALYAACTGRPVTAFRMSREMPLSDAERWIVAVFFHDLLKAVWSREVPALEIDRSIRMMYRLTPLFYERSGALYHAASAAAALIRPLRGGAGHIKPRRPSGDPLNQRHRKWEDPFSPGRASTLSVPELLEQARQEAVPALERIDQTGLFDFDRSLDFDGKPQ